MKWACLKEKWQFWKYSIPAWVGLGYAMHSQLFIIKEYIVMKWACLNCRHASIYKTLKTEETNNYSLQFWNVQVKCAKGQPTPAYRFCPQYTQRKPLQLDAFGDSQ